MKKEKVFLTGCLAGLMLASVLGLVSCTSSGEDETENSLVGTWTREYYLDGVGDASEWYMFASDETGRYENSSGTWASFTYKITARGYVSMKMIYQNGRNIWREEYGWSYSIEGDKLSLGSKTYTRKKWQKRT